MTSTDQLEVYHLPSREQLEQLGGYEDDEIAEISEAAVIFNEMPLNDRMELGPQFLRNLWPDPFTYAEKTHVILDNRQSSETFGQLVRLVPNYAQVRFIEVLRKMIAAGEPLRVIILKARQLGFSTFIQSFQYAQCELFPNRSSMTISFDDDSTKEMFQKAITIKRYQWMPPPCRRDSKGLIEFTNNSKFLTATAGKFNAGRSFTIHHLHCSEVPAWQDAVSVMTGVLQAVPLHPITSVFKESTAAGAVGSFYEDWKAAEEGRSNYFPFFAPWFWDPEYVYPFRTEEQRSSWSRRFLTPEDRKYQKTHDLTIEQMAWRYYKTQDGLEGNPGRFRQEYPATAREAFLTSGQPRFSAELVDALIQQANEPVWTGEIGPR